MKSLSSFLVFSDAEMEAVDLFTSFLSTKVNTGDSLAVAYMEAGSLEPLCP